jgi:CRISPR-associated protein Cas5t
VGGPALYISEAGVYMYYFSINLYATTASFRLPESHTFQQTLPLPPVTAMIGMAGAALGLNFSEAMQLREAGLKCGVWGKHMGESKDLWKYTKIKSGAVIPAVLTREILTDLELLIVFALSASDKLEELRKAFCSPKFALTAGTSDDLVKIYEVSNLIEGEPMPITYVENTVLPGDHSQNYSVDIDIKTLVKKKTVYAPQVYSLPVSFTFNGEERRVKSREMFTFIDVPVTLSEPVAGIMAGNKAVPLL